MRNTFRQKPDCRRKLSRSSRRGLLTVCVAALAAAGYSLLPSQGGKMSDRLKKRVVRTADRTEKVLYLTFDDGPHPVYTAKLLDMLMDYDIKATFFVVGKFAEEYPELIGRMKAEGHTIGLHSYEHKSAMLQTPSYTRSDFEKSINVLRKLGIEPVLYRPPWGHVNWVTLHMIRKYGLRKVLWDVMVQDWAKDSSEVLLQYKLLKRSREGSVICLHDGRGRCSAPARMLEALEKTIPVWLEEGYQFKAL